MTPLPDRVLEAVQHVTTAIGDGCGDNSCRYKRGRASGMGTNGGCCCHERRVVQMALRRLYEACPAEVRK